jgi:hypothetical protein
MDTLGSKRRDHIGKRGDELGSYLGRSCRPPLPPARPADDGLDPFVVGRPARRGGGRSGFSAIRRPRRGASVFKMRDVSRHKSMDMLQAYVRDADLFRDHAGAGLLYIAATNNAAQDRIGERGS